jgi:HEAT repeat protein
MRASADRESRLRVIALVAACTAIDAVAAVLLLLRTPLPPLVAGLAAAIAHTAAVLLLSGSARGRPSRRWLGTAAMLAVPCAGAAVATAVFTTKGRGSPDTHRYRRSRGRPAPAISALRRVAHSLSPCEALECGDEEQQRAALSGLARRGDPEAIALLRRAAASGDPDLAMSTALALDEIGERAERQAGRLCLVELRRAG